MGCLASPTYQTGACQCEPWKRKIKCHSIGIMISKSNHTKQDSHPSLLDVGAGIRVSTTANADLGRVFERFLCWFWLMLFWRSEFVNDFYFDFDFKFTSMPCLVAVFRIVEISSSVLKYQLQTNINDSILCGIIILWKLRKGGVCTSPRLTV